MKIVGIEVPAEPPAAVLAEGDDVDVPGAANADQAAEDRRDSDSGPARPSAENNRAADAGADTSESSDSSSSSSESSSSSDSDSD